MAFGGLYAWAPMEEVFWTMAGLAWMGGIQLLNRAAGRFPSALAGTVHWAHAMTFETFAILSILCAHASRCLPSYQRPSGSKEGRPILLVHGYFNDGSVWLVQKKRLKAAGLGPIYTIDLGSPFGSIVDYARKVAEKAAAIAEETGRSDLVLIGYSMGGLVCAWYATRMAPPSQVTDVVTIGAPFAGTPLAQIGPGQNAKEMRIGSELLKTLQEEIRKNPQIRFYHIASRCDEIALPGTAAALAEHNADRKFLIQDVGHAGLIYSKRVSQQICDWLS